MTAAGQATDDRSKFPVGMRVLAVDDDPTCLMLLDTLLRRCQYHVTTTSQAVMALKMLRENKNMFDLVISDVRMPDMDGFKLLELVGLEMDLPVIMLSAYGDTEHVMKGITHGACDYLLKPVRIEELRNIWQHVIRKRKIDAKDQKFVDKPHDDSVEVGEGFMGAGDTDQNDKITRKRKDQNGDEYEEHDKDGDINEDPSMQKKPRLVWSAELHRKFVAAVHQLGIDNAVPKRILEMMNVEKVTRENVASHLQKYRGYLKRINEAASHQANMVSVLGRADSAYYQGGSMNGLGDLHNLAMSGQIQNAAFRSFPPGGVLGRLNSPGLGMLGLSSSGIHRDHAQNSTNPVTGVTNFQSCIQPENQNGNILQGVPLSLELDQVQLNQNVSSIAQLSVSSNESNIYPISNVFSNGRTIVGSSSNSLLAVQNYPVAVEKHLQGTQMSGVLGNQSSHIANPLNSECCQSLDFKGFTDNWLNAVQSSENHSNSCTLSDCLNQTTQNNMRHVPTMAMHMATNPHARLADRGTDLQYQAAFVSSNGRKNLNFMPRKEWDDHEEYKSHMSNLIYSSTNRSIAPHYDVGPMGQRLDSGSMISYNRSDCSLVGQSNFLDPLPLQHNEVEQPAAQTTEDLKYGTLKGQSKPHGSYALSEVDTLEDLLTVMMKEEQNTLNKFEGR